MNETQISTFIQQQFPEIYREDGPFLVEFVKQYYIWTETDPTSPIYLARNYQADHDIDTTVDDFVVYFKEKYLKNIQLNTATNTKQLVKNSIDLYRAKGSENGIKLFFDLIFSAPVEVYYPGRDVFRLSDADWVIPQYIEVTARPVNRLLVGRQIRGVYSGATAFIESLVRRKVNSTYIEVFYVSAVSGQFQTGEIITLSGYSDVDMSQFPVMLGSLSSLDVVDGGDGFGKGEIVSLVSQTGSQGKAIVQSLQTITGIASFTLLDGGWGYTSDSHIDVSETVLQITNAHIVTSDNTSLYDRINTIVQPMANVQWYANTSNFVVGDKVFNYWANGSVRGTSIIISAEYGLTNTTNYFLLSTISGNTAPYTAGTYNYYKAANTSSFTVYNSGWTDETATGTLNGYSKNFNLVCNGVNPFTVNEYVYQVSFNNTVFARAQVTQANTINSTAFSISVNNLEGMFLTNIRLNGETNGGNVSINYASFDIGLIDVTGSFNNKPGNIIVDTSSNSLSTATVSNIPFGDGASVSFDSDLLNPEVVSISNNYLRDHVAVAPSNQLNATSYGASLNDANATNMTIGSSLTFINKTVGTIARLTQINPGHSYSYAPFVDVIDPLLAPMHKMDFVIRISDATGVFAVGEIVNQTQNGAIGLVKFANTSEVHIRRYSFEDRWAIGNTSTYMINGQTSGFKASVTEVTYDIDGVMGHNAVIDSKVTTSTTSAEKLKIYDSGFNYRNGETIRFVSNDGSRAGSALATVSTHGKATGYYKSSSGFLSDDKYLYDGDYYQDFSYEIRSPITLDRYSDMLKNILHVSGTKSFSSILMSAAISSETTHMSTDLEYGTV